MEAVHFRMRAAEMTKFLGLWLWCSHVLPPVQAPGRALKQVQAAREQLMYFVAGQCVENTGLLVKPVLHSGFQTVKAWRWNQVAMGCGRGGGRMREPSHRSQADLAVRDGSRSERAVLLALDAQCPVVGDQDVYKLRDRDEACSEIFVSYRAEWFGFLFFLCFSTDSNHTWR